MVKMSLFFRILLSVPKSIFFNFCVFKIRDAVKLPILVSYDTTLREFHKNCVSINAPLSLFMIKLNIFEGTEAAEFNKSKKGFLKIKKNRQIIFNGRANFACGIAIDNKGILVFGNNFSCNKNCFISCDKKIILGDNCLLGWNVSVRDSDGHTIYSGKEAEIGGISAVNIGNNVWLGANVKILKGVTIANNCVVGYNSCLTKKFLKDNCLIGGYPAKVLKEGIDWKK